MFPPVIENLIKSFSELPGVGRKTAERYILHLIKLPPEIVKNFSQALADLSENNFFCPICFNFSGANSPCSICRDSQRDQTTMCVVEEFSDINVIESTGIYRGLYHVLAGRIDPPEGITPDKLNISQLIGRIKTKKINEIILALNPDLAGEGTIIYLKNILKPLNVKISLLARGLPMGGNISYADEITLINAIKGRQEVK